MSEPIELLREWDRKNDLRVMRFYSIMTLACLATVAFDVIVRDWLGAIANLSLGVATVSFMLVRRVWVRKGYRHGRSVTLDHALSAVRAGVPFDVFYAAETLMIWTENDMHDHAE